jgi:hypothetical protein
MSDAMKSLLAKVEACKVANWFNWSSGIKGHGTNARLAYEGSLDAAKVLHEELLPNRSCGITFGGEYGATVTFPPTWDDLSLSQSHAIPARAWLIAILRAKIKEARA